jgi:hypothetical protein
LCKVPDFGIPLSVLEGVFALGEHERKALESYL